MYHGPEHIEELINVLDKYPFGIEFKALFKATTLFNDEAQLSSCIHRTNQLGKTYKKEGRYFKTLSVEETLAAENNRQPIEAKVPDKTTQEIYALMRKAAPNAVQEIPPEPQKQAKVVVTEAKYTEVKPLPSSGSKVIAERVPRTKEVTVVNNKPMGRLWRNSCKGLVAFLIYKRRLEAPVSRKDVYEMLKKFEFSDSSFYQAYHGLKQQGIISETHNSEGAVSKWTGQFFYPFADMKLSDDDLLGFSVSQYFDKKSSVQIDTQIAETPAIEIAELPVQTAIVTQIGQTNTRVNVTNDDILNGPRKEVGLSSVESYAIPVFSKAKSSQYVMHPNEKALDLIEYKLKFLQQEIDSLLTIKRLLTEEAA